MRIGICSHITLRELASYLNEDDKVRAEGVNCISAPSVDALVVSLLKLGHEVIVFSLADSIVTSVHLKGENLTIHVCPRRKRARTLALTFFGKEIRYLRGEIAKEKLDILHAQWTYEYALGAEGAECPVVCTVRDIAEEILLLVRDAYRFFRYLMNARVFWRYEKYHFIANSPYTADKIAHYHPKVKCKVIPNSVKDEFIAKELSPRSRPVIISVSTSWDERKNYTKLLEAFAKIKAEMSNAELLLVGAPFSPSSPPVMEIMKSHPDWLQGVKLLGAVKHSDLVGLYRQAMVMVHPSQEETFGNILIEAMGAGIAVVGGAQSGAVPYVLDYGKAGVLCDVTSADDIFDKTIGLLRDAEFRNRIVQNGYERVISCFSAEHVARSTIAYYEEVVG